MVRFFRGFIVGYCFINCFIIAEVWLERQLSLALPEILYKQARPARLKEFDIIESKVYNNA